jgi:hypothetical protein
MSNMNIKDTAVDMDICWEEEELGRMLYDMETEDTVLKQTLPLVELKKDRIEEDSTTTYDIMEQARGKKRLTTGGGGWTLNIQISCRWSLFLELYGLMEGQTNNI